MDGKICSVGFIGEARTGGRRISIGLLFCAGFIEI